MHQGDAGIVRESWSFLGKIYYTVEFFTSAAVVIMRGREMAKAARRGLIGDYADRLKPRGSRNT